MTDTLLGVRGIEKLSPGGRRAIVDVSNALGINPDWLATVISFESAGSFDPAKKNGAGSGATGLIQFMPSTAARYGTTTAQLAQMSQEEQIRGPVFHYLSDKGKLRSLDDTYLAVFFPSAIGQSDDYVVGLREGGTDFQAAVYRQNAGFDSSSSGVIRRGDIVSTIRGLYNSALRNPRVAVPASELWRTALYFVAFGAAAGFIIKHGLRHA